MRPWLLLTLGAATLAAQRESFDLFSYPAPAGYQKRESPTFVEWSRINQARRYYCQIGIYRAQNSSGAAAQDLEAEWKAAVAPSFRTRGEARSQAMALPQAPDSMARIAETTDARGQAAVTTLIVVRMPGRYVGVLFNVSNEEAFNACYQDAVAVAGGIQMNAAAAPAPAAVSGAPAGGAVPLPGTLQGSWERIIASQAPTRYNPITRVWEHDYAGALNQFRNVYRWRFAPNGEYTWELDAESFNRGTRSRVIERGRYTVAGGAVQLQPAEHREGTGPRGQDPPLAAKTPRAPYSLRFTIGEHPQYKDAAGLQIQEPDGSWATYRPAQR
jgi:hypothetical protein